MVNIEDCLFAALGWLPVGSSWLIHSLKNSMAAVILEGIKFNPLEVKIHLHLQQDCLCQLCLG